MNLHNSTQMGSATTSTRKFLIRYQQRQKQSDQKTNKSTNTPKIGQSISFREYVPSEADEIQVTHSNEPKSSISKKEGQRATRPRFYSFNSPAKVTTMIDLINSPTPQTAFLKDKQQAEKEYPKIPIEYNEQKINGPLADASKLKIVFRGYAPKNTYYYLKFLAGNSIPNKSSLIKPTQFQLYFDSKFQSGNLSAVVRKSAKEFFLFMREDTNTFGLRQWFYYSVTSKKAGKYKFRIYKFSKFHSLYKVGMKPYCRVMGPEIADWRQGGQNIKYQKDDQTKYYFLQFQYQFPTDNATVQFAAQPPYTYTMLREYLKLALQKYPGIQVIKAGQTISGLEIPKIEIITRSESRNSNGKRKVIVLIARTHPGETASNWTVESMIDRIYQVPELMAYYDFYFVPMVNPDGVFLGNHRTGVLGQDINRNFSNNDIEFFPEVDAVQKLIESIQKDRDRQIQFLLDLHGHSARKNIFAYGDEHPTQSNLFIKTHILPKLLSQAISTFKYNYCVFKASKQKKNTARVYLSKKYKINAITFEQSYGLIDEGTICIQHWSNFGIALADSLKTYYELLQQGSYKRLKQELSNQIGDKKQKSKTKKQKKEKKQKKQEIVDLKTQQNIKTKDNEKIKTQFECSFTDFNFKPTREEQEPAPCQQIQEKCSDDSANSSQLSSGDEDLENNGDNFDLLKKEILKIGCLKDGLKREKYNIAERNLEIKKNFQPRLHEQRSSMAPRILKFQMRKRDEQTSARHEDKQEERFEERSMEKKKVSPRGSFLLPYLRKEK